MANITLLEHAKRFDPKGAVATIAELLQQTNQILLDATYVEGNLTTGHRVTIQTGLPEVYFRSLNQGVPTSRGKTTQVDESCSIMEARSEIDMALADLNNSSSAFRLSEARMFIEAMNQRQAEAMFYGNPAVDVKEYLGLAPRYSDLSAGNAQNILDAGGTDTNGTQTSAWLVCWSDQTVFCIYPQGSQAGLFHEDLGQMTIQDTGGVTGARMEALCERFVWTSGLVVKDWRYAVRIANIGTADADVNDIVTLDGSMDPASTSNLLHQMVKAISKIPMLGMGKMCWYMNRTVFTGLQRIGLEKSNNAVQIHPALDQFGKPQAMLSFQGIPIRQCDALTNEEERVT